MNFVDTVYVHILEGQNFYRSLVTYRYLQNQKVTIIKTSSMLYNRYSEWKMSDQLKQNCNNPEICYSTKITYLKYLYTYMVHYTQYYTKEMIVGFSDICGIIFSHLNPVIDIKFLRI